MFWELHDGFIGVSGSDAGAFLQAQLTSDVLSLTAARTQYSGYCSPKGRLLATFLVWRTEDEFLLQLPASIAAAVRARLAKYVLRSRVTLADASDRFRVFGLAGDEAQKAVARIAGDAPRGSHDVVARNGILVTRLHGRDVIMAPTRDAQSFAEALGSEDSAGSTDDWLRKEIEAGVPWITRDTEDRFVPQMVNLDLLGGVSYQKGCYPGQEIVARTHYLGRLKQRLYRIRFRAPSAPRAADSLYAVDFGADQACGTIVNVAPAGDGEYEALAVIQISVAQKAVHWGALDGPTIELLSLPYAIPD